MEFVFGENKIALVLRIITCFLFALDGPAQTSKNIGIQTDTTINIFNSNDYFLTFHVFPAEKDHESHIGTLSLTRKLKGETITLLHDTLEFFMPLLEFKDFNNDKVKDVLILNSSSARSVLTHHLYIVDNNNHELIRVKDFEEIYNPEFDPKTNIISSTAYYNKVGYSFYRIGRDYKVIDLGHSFEGDLSEEDNIKYQKAIKSILKGK